jgi:hypothetical protein
LAQVAQAPRAEELFDEGVRALHRLDYEDARVRFEQSVALAPRGSVLLDLAKAEWALGRHVDAVQHLRAALRRSDLPAENRESSERGLDRWSATLGHIAVVTDTGASVRVDQAPIERLAPLADPVDVEPGPHLIETRLGDWSGRVEVDAKPGGVTEARAFVVHPALPAAAPGMPTDLRPQAQAVLIDSPARTNSDAVAVGPFWNTQRAVGVGIAGAGVASLVVGGVFYALASRDENRATSAAPPGLGPSGCAGSSRPSACVSQDMALSAERSDGAISRVAMGIGLGAVLLGGVIFAWPSSKPPSVALSATARPDGGELHLQGSF